MTDATELDEAAIRARYQRACGELDRMTQAEGGPGAAWRWSIPANPERDTDLILSDSLADLPAALDEITRLRAALDEARAELRHWTDIATDEQAARQAAEQERDEAQEHIARWLSENPPLSTAERVQRGSTGDLAVDMMRYADRLKARAEAAESEVERLNERPLCACGHPPYLHDDEAVPALCLNCGHADDCGDAAHWRAKEKALREFHREAIAEAAETVLAVGAKAKSEKERADFLVKWKDSGFADRDRWQAKAEAVRALADELAKKPTALQTISMDPAPAIRRAIADRIYAALATPTTTDSEAVTTEGDPS